jgi:hypothetical protein
MRQRKYLTKNKNKWLEILPIILREDFDILIDKIRKKYPRVQTSSSRISIIKGKNRNISSEELEKDVELVLQKFNLPYTYFDFVKEYINSNLTALQDETDPDGVVVEISNDNAIKEKRYSLLLHSQSTLKDIKKVWPLIEKEIGRVKKRKKRSLNFGRNWDIYKLAESGKSISEIATKVEKSYGSYLDFGLIKAIVSKIRKIQKIKKKFKLPTYPLKKVSDKNSLT